MPLPLGDVTQAYRSSAEKTEQALTKVGRALLRNNQTQRFSQRQALRLHQGLVTSTAEQVMERLCVRVQQQVCVLRGAGEGEELQAARQVLKEARNSRALYPSLCELAHVLSVDGPVRQKLDSLAGELAKAADKELQVIVDSMVSLCQELCPFSSSAAEHLTPPLSSVSERVSIPRSTIRAALMERAAQDIHRALEEVKLSVVSYLTNSIVDQILQELYSTHKALTRQVSQVKRWDEGGTGRRSHRHRDSLDITDEELGTSIDTIAINKRSSRTRRIRPVSTRLSLGDDASSSPPSSVLPHSAPLSRSASWECLSALPTQGAPLRHVTRVRPRPPRKHRRGHAPPEAHCTENGAVTPLDDGFPDFYTKRVLPDSQLSSLHQAQSFRRKKRRTMLSIFGFRRNRNSTISTQESIGDPGACGEECRTVASTPSNSAPDNIYTIIQPERDCGKADSPREGTEGTEEEQKGEGQPGVRPTPGIGGGFSQKEGSEQDTETDTETDRPSDTDRRADEPEEAEQGRDDRQTDGQVQGPRPQAEGQKGPQTDGRTETSPRDVHRESFPCGLKPDPPPQSSKPSLAQMRQRHLQESSEASEEEEAAVEREEEEERRSKTQGHPPPIPEKPVDLHPISNRSPTDTPTTVMSPKEAANERKIPPPVPPSFTKPIMGSVDMAVTQDEEGGKGTAPMKPHRNRKSLSCDMGFERDSPSNPERLSDRKPPTKKPRLPQNRNKSLDLPGNGSQEYGNSEAS
ncbi:hypothetical protein SKAU_G00377690 [Synaphobranchus kaupii]|uniref:CARMIL C-terminal domain-containing protein n=1 Tax=Synaphobranchus kaupii TaxID=118154 RepID=A0A9Q1ED16_SYNKA|nr:hypothetical protein SKAU_G00377690 [Synaphobranchus kaupii]